MRVRDIMSAPAVTVSDHATLEEVARVMLDRSIGGVPVVRPDGRMAGIITESDFTAKRRPVPFSLLSFPSVFGHWLHDTVERVYEEARAVRAGEVMTDQVVSVSEDDTVERALWKMCERKVHRLPVLRGGVPVGMVTRQDFLRLMLHEPRKCGAGCQGRKEAAPAAAAAPTHS